MTQKIDNFLENLEKAFNKPALSDRELDQLFDTEMATNIKIHRAATVTLYSSENLRTEAVGSIMAEASSKLKGRCHGEEQNYKDRLKATIKTLSQNINTRKVELKRVLDWRGPQSNGYQRQQSELAALEGELKRLAALV